MLIAFPEGPVFVWAENRKIYLLEIITGGSVI